MFERPHWGYVRVTRVRRAEIDDFSSSRKVLFFSSHWSSRCCYGCIHHVQHRLFTASVSHGGHLFLLLPSCVLQSISISKTKTCAFFLRALFFFGYWLSRRYISRRGWCVSKPKMGILCILYGVGLTCNCMSSAFGSVEADCLRIGASRFISLSVLIIFLGPRGIGRCRRWKNGYTYEFSGSDWEGQSEPTALGWPREGKLSYPMQFRKSVSNYYGLGEVGPCRMYNIE